MTANFELTIKFTIVQELEEINEILDFYEIAEQGCQSLADQLTDRNAVCSYEIVSGKMGAK